MEAMTSVWSYQENVDQLKEMLLYTTFELETARNEAREEMRRNEENVNQLVQLLKVACQERDEARDQLQRLMNKISTPTSPLEAFSLLPSLIQPTSLSINPTKGNSTITETDSLSEIYNHHSYGSSPVESFFDGVSSPEFSNMNMADSSNVGRTQKPLIHESNRQTSIGTIVTPGMTQQPLIHESNGQTSIGTIVTPGMTKTDQSNAEIENLVKGKPLPQKGNLLQTVMEAGPLLQTLLLAGPLPRWRNPPPLQPFQLPQLSILGCDTELIHQKPDSISTSLCSIQNPSSMSYNDVSHMYPTSMLNFSSVPSNCLNRGQVLSTRVKRDCTLNSVPTGKRTRFQ